ncbi:hypothetical protein BDA99DRAFT_497484 [Phascolomyces articulosus]|uniref:Uncharacterized protein n=1 Tax=Phascolomyces articulosus TaxID=60185 RepID=A0AAD5KKU7_9FUNG|nr:hypothetical protein BDA99DRAFT_497484 [Phascolomyces articulosus]
MNHVMVVYNNPLSISSFVIVVIRDFFYRVIQHLSVSFILYACQNSIKRNTFFFNACININPDHVSKLFL